MDAIERKGRLEEYGKMSSEALAELLRRRVAHVNIIMECLGARPGTTVEIVVQHPGKSPRIYPTTTVSI